MKRRCTAVLGMMIVFMCALLGCAKIGSGGRESNAAASKKEEAAVIVTMPTTSEPEAGFDPVYGWGAGEHVHEPLIQSTLTTTKTDLTIGKDLAVDYAASDDGMIWTVTIREDVSFTDGQPLTASDVAFTYNLCKEKSTVSDFTMLNRAEAVDNTTILFHMTTPFSIWPYTMAVVGIVPEHAYDENYGRNPIGSGRYVLKQWNKGQQVIFEANPQYYGETPKMKRLTVLFMEEESALAAAMAGQTDVSHTAALYSEQKLEGYHLEAVQTVDNRGFNLPVSEPVERDGITYGNAFTADVSVRRAINLAINRDETINNVQNGHGTKAFSVCDGMPWYNENAEVSYNPEEAERLLEQAGWKKGADGVREKDGVKAEFSLLFSNGDSVRQALAEDVANQLAELGIQVRTEGVGWDTAYDRAQADPMIWGWGAHTPMELYNIYHTAKAGQARYSPYANEKVDEYMDAALRAKTPEESYTLWQKAQWDGNEGITQNGNIPWIWLCNVEHLYFVRDGLTIAEQKIHPHGHGWSIVNNVDQWTWK